MTIQISVNFDWNNQRVLYGVTSPDQNLSGFHVALLDHDARFLTNRAVLNPSDIGRPDQYNAQQAMGLSGATTNDDGTLRDPRSFSSLLTDSSAFREMTGRSPDRYKNKRAYVYRGDFVYYDEISSKSGQTITTSLRDPTALEPNEAPWVGNYLVPIDDPTQKFVITSIATDAGGPGGKITVDGKIDDLADGAKFEVWPVRTVTGDPLLGPPYELFVTGKFLTGVASIPHQPLNTDTTNPYNLLSGSAPTLTFSLPQTLFSGLDILSGDGFLYTQSDLSVGTSVVTEARLITGYYHIDVRDAGLDPHGSTAFWSLIRENHWALEFYPKFGETYLAAVITGDEVVASNPVTVPQAELEVNFNEFDSVVSNGSKSQFFVGPLSVNGETITGGLMEGSIHLLDGRWLGITKTVFFSNRHYDNAANFTGNYFREGIFVGVSSQTFTAADMLQLRASVSIGDNVVNKLLPIAVQPPI